MQRLAVVGAGHVGLVTGACLAELGHHVSCIDSNASTVAELQVGMVPFYEPGLPEMVRSNMDARRLSFHRNAAAGISDADCVFIAVGTPVDTDGRCDLGPLRSAAHDVARCLTRDTILVNKSTVPVETGDLVTAIVREHRKAEIAVATAYNPEFMREGSAIADFMRPDRIVVGSSDAKAITFLQDLYAPLGAPLIVTDVRTAEMIKCSANAFLATKISFINEIAALCERVGANAADVAMALGADRRIAADGLRPGLGFGGSCLPKDLSALLAVAAELDVELDLLPAVRKVNRGQIGRLLHTLQASVGEVAGLRVTVLGISFKPNTDDVRDSPALNLIHTLLDHGAEVTTHDPVVEHAPSRRIGQDIDVEKDCYVAIAGADVVIIATDWDEFRELDFKRVKKLMRGNTILDGRNLYRRAELTCLGFNYLSLGNSSSAHPDHAEIRTNEHA